MALSRYETWKIARKRQKEFADKVRNEMSQVRNLINQETTELGRIRTGVGGAGRGSRKEYTAEKRIQALKKKLDNLAKKHLVMTSKRRVAVKDPVARSDYDLIGKYGADAPIAKSFGTDRPKSKDAGKIITGKKKAKANATITAGLKDKPKKKNAKAKGGLVRKTKRSKK